MDGIEELTHDHKRLRELFSVVESAHSKESLEDSYVELRVQFEIHGLVEIESAWPLVRSLGNVAGINFEADEDWRDIRDLFGRLDEYDVGTPKWREEFLNLKRRSFEHFDLEEKEVFTFLKSNISQAESEQLLESIAEIRLKYGADVSERRVERLSAEL